MVPLHPNKEGGSKSALIAKERRAFWWICFWGILGTVLWLSRWGYLVWVQREISARIATIGTLESDTRYYASELPAFLKEIEQKAGFFQAAMVGAGILFAISLGRWILAIQKRRRSPAE